MSTGCNHTFCHECILHALSRSDGCPLCKSHVHKRGLNRVDHLEQVIEAFNQLKEAFEQEDGHSKFLQLILSLIVATKNLIFS